MQAPKNRGVERRKRVTKSSNIDVVSLFVSLAASSIACHVEGVIADEA